ncbi:bifunctional protein HldE [includes: D-beta-D-heptose 7-phosphate kinase; D-beta-D-heptose 1-phosphate adenosyltransferase] [Escherichia coli]|uniref:Bifunctional protein HldE [includes: D-beta-D-heptose 7-phosphate kinase D-beta-D-heptose 1-phosphate adenosyltransferase] n=1 Tax=Escherichia coli TaxID=562 RepID=A0A376KM45_ECOLX|nr:bifunctional protein HldE [includes: D-beta-D-heptose 7-phosphate kinase; D-beta-D-heptose 1-phosphate adenosyltransferase] [Escherichia coli]
MCRRIASPQSVNWCGQAGRSGWWKNEVWYYRAQILNLSGDRNESNAARVERAGVMVVGDVMLDRYWYGPTSRISPEAPVPVVKVNTIEERPAARLTWQ